MQVQLDQLTIRAELYVRDCDTSYPHGQFVVGSTEETGGGYAPRSQRRIEHQTQADSA